MNEDTGIKRLERSRHWVWTAMDPQSKLLLAIALGPRTLDVHFVSPVPVECHAHAGGHPVSMALGPWIPACAGMTRGHKHWQCMYEMDL